MSIVVNATIRGNIRQVAGSTSFASDNGWTVLSSANYMVGSNLQVEYRGFLGFDLSGLSAAVYTNAQLTLVDPEFGDLGITNQDLSIVDLSADYAALLAGSGGTTLFGHWGSATVVGSVINWGLAQASALVNGDGSTSLPVNLNAAGLAACNAAVGAGSVAFGLMIPSLSLTTNHLLFLDSHNESVACFLTLS